MASVNTSFGYSLGLPGAISITGSSETQIVVPAFSYNSGSPVPSPAFAAGAPLQVQFPADVPSGSSTVDGHPFNVNIVGVITPGTAATTFQPILYLGNSTTLTSGNRIVAPTAQAAAAGSSFNFQMKATLLWDSVSKALNGNATFQCGNVAVASTTSLTNQQTSVSESGLIFTFSTTFASQTGTASLYLKEFTISAA